MNYKENTSYMLKKLLLKSSTGINYSKYTKMQTETLHIPLHPITYSGTPDHPDSGDPIIASFR